MNEIIINAIFFVLTLEIVFFGSYLFLGKEKLSKEDKKKKIRAKAKIMDEGYYIIKKFNLDEKRINVKEFNIGLSAINGLIIAFITTLVSSIKLEMIWLFIIAFFLLLAMIYACFEIYGRFLEKKWSK